MAEMRRQESMWRGELMFFGGMGLGMAIAADALALKAFGFVITAVADGRKIIHAGDALLTEGERTGKKG